MEQRIKSLENKVESIEEKLDILIKAVLNINTKLDEATQKIDENFNVLDERISSLSDDSNKGFSSLHTGLGEIKHEITKIQVVSKYDEVYENLRLLSIVK